MVQRWTTDKPPQEQKPNYLDLQAYDGQEAVSIVCTKSIRPRHEVLKQAKLEFLSKQSIPQPYDLSNMNDEEREAYIAQ